jgi:hypothetical protein
MTKFVKFPSIEKFSDVNAHVKRHFDVENRPKVLYRGKCKLHGTNASIRVDSDGLITCGKRSDICTIESDNAGFARHVETIKTEIPVIGFNYVLFGEWAGPGIQKKAAVSLIEKKTFFVFAMLNLETGYIAVDPTRIVTWLGTNILPFEIIPWHLDATVEIDFRLQSSMEAAMKQIGAWVEACDKVDPYVKDRYGIEGIGEGFVFTPFVDEMPFTDYSNYLFKAKGESHAGTKGDKAKIEIDPAVLEGATAFAIQFVTEARCSQGVTEACDGVAATKNIGPFMAWLGADVKKESVNELEASGLEWKQVSKAVNQYAREWFLLEIEKAL